MSDTQTHPGHVLHEDGEGLLTVVPQAAEVLDDALVTQVLQQLDLALQSADFLLGNDPVMQTTPSPWTQICLRVTERDRLKTGETRRVTTAYDVTPEAGGPSKEESCVCVCVLQSEAASEGEDGRGNRFMTNNS